MRIVMAGSSGFLGTRLRERLAADGHEVTRLVRREPTGADEVRWDPSAGELDPTALSGADAVVNLTGANVGRRWTTGHQRRIRASRIDTTGTLATVMAQLPAANRPRVFLQQSAVGWYGDTGERPVEEDAPAGTGFLADTVRLWEAAANPAEDAGVRVVLMRTGLPLDPGGGLLKPQLLAFRLGLGGRLGSGRQWLPWISMADWLEAVVFLLGRADIAGPVNVVGPHPVTNAEFTRALAAAVHRPAVLPVPGVALRALLGGFGAEAVKSQRVMPGVVTRAGFEFRHATVQAALRAALHPRDRAAR